jgi:hypothetical protein
MPSTGLRRNGKEGTPRYQIFLALDDGDYQTKHVGPCHPLAKKDVAVPMGLSHVMSVKAASGSALGVQLDAISAMETAAVQGLHADAANVPMLL